MHDETGEIPQHHNQLRRWAAEHSADRVVYEAFRSLAEARERPDAAAILDTSRDRTLAVFPASRIVADEATLDLLLADLEAVARELDDGASEASAAPSHGRVFYETMAAVRATHWDAGDHLWLDDELFAVDLAKAVEDVLRGVSPRIDPGALDRIPLLREWWPAVERGDLDAVRDLLDRGVRVDAGDRARSTALARSTRDGDLAKMRLLLDRGADPNAPGWQSRTPTTNAASRAADWPGEHVPAPRPLEMLLAAGGRLGLREAVILGDVELARKLLDEDPSIDLSGDARHLYEMTFLKVAAFHGNPEMARFLLDAGADLEGRAEIVALLLDRGAAIDRKDPTGRTPLALAAEHGRVEVVRLLSLLPVDLAEREGRACIAEFLHARRVGADERLRWDY